MLNLPRDLSRLVLFLDVFGNEPFFQSGEGHVSPFQSHVRMMISSAFQSLIKNSRNSILTLGFVPHIKLVLSDIGQVSAYLLVWETAGLSDLG